LAGSLLSIGRQFAQAGRNDEAIDYCTRAETVVRAVAAAKSATAADRDDLAACQTNVADLLRKAGRRDEARAACERARALRGALVRNHPEFTEYSGGLAETELRTGQALLDAGDAAGAAAAWKRSVALYDGLKYLTISQAFFRSCCHAGLAGLATRPGSGVSAGEGQSESERAMNWLRRAVALGYRNPDAYLSETAFDPLRNRPDFRALMMDLAFPAEPFIRGE
jgi:eukaryotic-like serine/threonine-protein kinase